MEGGRLGHRVNLRERRERDGRSRRQPAVSIARVAGAPGSALLFMVVGDAGPSGRLGAVALPCGVAIVRCVRWRANASAAEAMASCARLLRRKRSPSFLQVIRADELGGGRTAFTRDNDHAIAAACLAD
jgi:hypothetical protein